MSAPTTDGVQMNQVAGCGGRIITVAATQMSCSDDLEDNLRRAEALVRRAAAAGAQIVLLQELFAGLYFCQEQRAEHLERARECSLDASRNEVLHRFSGLARELQLVLPVSYFERCNNAFYNSVAVLDSDGSLLGHYRKSHIPDGPGYQEKFYFTPGDAGFCVHSCRQLGVTIGVGICWDQWFPEAARAMALMGAELLFYPTAIGSEPPAPHVDSSAHWTRCMQGHAAANVVPVVASNRVGTEVLGKEAESADGGAQGLGFSSNINPGSTARSSITFYGHSFIADHTGALLAQAGAEGGRDGVVLTAAIDVDAANRYRWGWGVFRDRRPELYGVLCSKDGRTLVPAAPPCNGNGVV